MTIAKVIRYSIRPEDADDNERLIGEVFTELAVDHPDGLRYAAFRLDDGVSFVHVALVDDDDNPLSRSPAFARFQSGFADRVADGPDAADGSMIGSYGGFTA
jgi:hypothetical protein